MSRSSQPSTRPAEAGFSLVEMLVVVLLIGLLAVWGYPSFLGTLNRLRLTNAAREAAVFMQVARMEATKRSVPTRVVYQDAASGLIGKPALLAYADLNSNNVYDAATDRVLAGPYELQKGVQLWGPLETTAEGTSAIQTWCTAPPFNNCGPTFASNGSADSVGAFRFRDRLNNIIEVRIDFAGTGKVVLQKWDGDGDTANDWWENGENGNNWVWAHS